MRKIITRVVLFLIIGFFIFRYFFYIDISNSCYLRIKPSLTEFSTSNIKSGIKVLKYAVPEEYEKLCKHVKRINPNLGCGGLGGGCYYSNNVGNKEIDVSTAHGSYIGWTAGVIAHETCHAIQHQEQRPFSEEECYAVSNEVLKRVIEF